MEIFINGVPISFQLESEQTVGQVYQGLESWLNGSGHQVTAVLVNGEEPGSGDAWRDTALAGVERIEISALSMHQDAIDRIETITTYLDLLGRVSREGTPQQLAAALEELPHVTTALSGLVPELEGTLHDELVTAAQNDASDARDTLARRADELAAVLRQRQRELLDPEHELRQTITALHATIPAFEEIPAQMQRGEEREALGMVARFAELTGRLLRILPLAIAQRQELSAQADRLPELNELFGELETALNSNDLVLVGDVMEYELLPRLSELLEGIGSILHGAQS